MHDPRHTHKYGANLVLVMFFFKKIGENNIFFYKKKRMELFIWSLSGFKYGVLSDKLIF